MDEKLNNDMKSDVPVYDIDWIQNPEVFSIGQVTPHTTLFPHASKEDVMQKSWLKSERVHSLDGTWRFYYSSCPAERPKDFYKNDFDTTELSTIEVPGCWELQGFGIPIYVNDRYPFPKNPPFVPEDNNPVGAYKRSFDIPRAWDGMRLFIRFGAVK